MTHTTSQHPTGRSLVLVNARGRCGRDLRFGFLELALRGDMITYVVRNVLLNTCSNPEWLMGMAAGCFCDPRVLAVGQELSLFRPVAASRVAK